MRHLICANTPAHVHLYRHTVDQLLDRGHTVLVLARDDACTLELCEYYDLPYERYGVKGASALALAADLPRQSYNLIKYSRQFEPDVVFGRGAYAALAGSVTDARTVLVLDSNPWDLGVVGPARLADHVLTTAAFDRDLGPHHYRFQGVTESAYLHPDVRSHTDSVREELDVGTNEEYALVRFNVFDAFHDFGESGFDVEQGRTLVQSLSEHLTVFISDEKGGFDIDDLPARRYDLHPARIHDALAEASLFVADTGTMVTEAALLGTPTVRASRRAGEDDLGEFVDLHERGLIRNVHPNEARSEALDLVADSTADDRWRTKRDEYFRDHVALTSVLVRVAENPGRCADIVRAANPDLAATSPTRRTAEEV